MIIFVAMEIITSIFVTVIIAAGTSFIGLLMFKSVQEEKNKVANHRISDIENELEKLKVMDNSINHSLAELTTSHRLTNKYMEDFRTEQKEENHLTRKALTENTAAISSLESLLARIEKKL